MGQPLLFALYTCLLLKHFPSKDCSLVCAHRPACWRGLGSFQSSRSLCGLESENVVWLTALRGGFTTEPPCVLVLHLLKEANSTTVSWVKLNDSLRTVEHGAGHIIHAQENSSQVSTFATTLLPWKHCFSPTVLHSLNVLSAYYMPGTG